MTNLTSLHVRWLVLIGYEAYRWGVTAWSYDGEEPPYYGYYPNVYMKKGIKIKRIRFKQLATPDKEIAEQLGRSIFRELLHD